MDEHSERFIGLDTSKLKISVAVAEGERNGEVRFFEDISAELTSVASMVATDLAHRHAARVHRDDLVVEVGETALVFGDQLRKSSCKVRKRT